MAGKITTQLVVEGQDKTAAAFDRVDRRLSGLSAAAKTAAGVIAGALSVNAFAEWAKGAADAAVEMGKLATLANSSAEVVSGWAYAARSVGIEQDKLGDIFKDTQDKVGDFLLNGGGELKDFFENIAPALGVTAEQFRDLSGPDALLLYVSSLEKANLSHAEMVTALEAIADDGSLLLPILKNGAQGLKDLTDEARQLGLIVSSETAAGAKAFNQQLTTLGAVSEGVGQQVAAEMLPAMTDLTGLFADYARDGQAVTTVANAISAAMKVLATIVIAVGTTFANLGRTIGGVAAAGAAALRGDFSEAGQILRDMVADNEQATKDAERRMKGLWAGTYAETGKAAAQAQDDLGKLNKSLGKGTVRTNSELSDAYKKLAKDAKDALREMASAEKDALRDVEKIRKERLDVEKRYSDALAALNATGSGEPSYSGAQDLKVAARQALQAGDLDAARRNAQAALDMLQELAKAGENTYGFEGFINELKQIELGANDIEQSQADAKLAGIRQKMEELKASADALEDIEVKPVMSEEQAAQLKSQMESLAAQLGQTLTIPVSLQPVAATAGADPVSIPGHATGGYISGPGSGTSDSILARLSNGEYVLRAAAVRHYGPALLNAMNGLRLPKFADGGLIGDIGPATPDSLGTVNLNLDGRNYPMQAGADVFAELHKARLKFGRTRA